MNALTKRIYSGLLALLLIFSLLSGSLPVVSYAATNTESRHNYDVDLSSQALNYYTGNYTWEILSALEGGSESCLDMDSDMFDALHTLMSTTMTKSVSYSSLTSHWPTTDGNILFYSDFKSSDYNREHVWPKSHASFHEKNGGADLHHLRPTNSTINSTRGNYTFGNVTKKVSDYRTKENGGQTVIWYSTTYSVGGSDGLVEVRDNIKGDVARILLYVWCRWEEPNLFEKDTSPTVGSGDEKNDGLKVIENLDTLLEWCKIDPVDSWEMTRNDLTQNVQGNRNVFIDYPEFAWLIFGQDVPTDYNTPSDNGGTAVNPGTPGCSHQWSTATCTQPQICSRCGATNGTALGHTWKAATCLQAKTCTVCNTTEGALADHVDANRDNACDVCKTSMGTAPQTGNVYIKVTEAPSNWAGQYLIVYEGGKLALDGSLTKLDDPENTIPVTISNNKILLDDKYANSYVLIAAKGSGYSIKTASGYYIGQTSNANGLASSTSTSYENALSISGGNLTAKSGGAYLRFNDDSGQMRFRYYKSGTYSAQEPVALYKLHTHSYTETVTQKPTCSKEGIKTFTCTCGASYTQSIAVIAHVEIAIPAVKASCTVSGWTAGVKCSACSEILTAPIETGTLPHTNVYTDNGNGTHKYACDLCGAVETASADHSYDNNTDTDCNDCGAVREVDVRTDTLTALSTSLRGNIGFKMYFKLSPETLADANAYVVFMIDGKEIGRRYMSEASGPDSDGDYAFECEVAAAQMTKKVSVQIVYGDGTAGAASEYSIKDYALKRINNPSAPARVKALLKAMLNYGAYAQLCFGYNTGDLANAGISDLPVIDGVTADSITQSNVQTGKATGIVINGYSTLLESETTFKFSYTLESGANIADYQFSYVSEEGETGVLTPKLDTDGSYCVYIENIPAAYLDRMYTVTVTNKKDNTSYSLESCVLCYTKSVIKNNKNTEAKINMAKALYLYSQAANEYFGK